MEELTVIGAENGALVVVDPEGTRFRVPITEALHTAIRQNRPAHPAAHRVSPREIQSHIRSGMSAAEVVEMTGEALEYVQRFEGPVLAEREYVVTAARSVPVAVAADTDSGVASHTFGAVIDRRLDELGATETTWSSWKSDALWNVRVAFTDADVSREALWSFDPKKSTLVPANHEAQSLSQQGETPASVLPRLRAVTTDPGEQSTRFDSGAFQVSPEALAPAAPSRAGIRTDPEEESVASPGAQTADLLEALRRRRGERESAPGEDWDSARAAHPSTGSIRIVDVPLDVEPDISDTADAPTVRRMVEAAEDPLASPFLDEPESASAASPGSSPAPVSPVADGGEAPSKPNRRGRAAMPSWDEIVFGARSEDDPA